MSGFRKRHRSGADPSVRPFQVQSSYDSLFTNPSKGHSQVIYTVSLKQLLTLPPAGDPSVEKRRGNRESQKKKQKTKNKKKKENKHANEKNKTKQKQITKNGSAYSPANFCVLLPSPLLPRALFALSSASARSCDRIRTSTSMSTL